eukprot:363139-Amorphochlora_amoeboformis.AAC.1
MNTRTHECTHNTCKCIHLAEEASARAEKETEPAPAVHQGQQSSRTLLEVSMYTLDRHEDEQQMCVSETP